MPMDTHQASPCPATQEQASAAGAPGPVAAAAAGFAKPQAPHLLGFHRLGARRHVDLRDTILLHRHGHHDPVLLDDAHGAHVEALP